MAFMQQSLLMTAVQKLVSHFDDIYSKSSARHGHLHTGRSPHQDTGTKSSFSFDLFLTLVFLILDLCFAYPALATLFLSSCVCSAIYF